jgi:hypothetical protein
MHEGQLVSGWREGEGRRGVGGRIRREGGRESGEDTAGCRGESGGAGVYKCV